MINVISASIEKRKGNPLPQQTFLFLSLSLSLFHFIQKKKKKKKKKKILKQYELVK